MKKFMLPVMLLISFIMESVLSFAGIIQHTAYYADTALAKAQAKLTENFQSPEHRYTDPAVYRLFLQQAPIMFPAYETLRTREDRTVEAGYRQMIGGSVSTGRSHTHSGNYGTSGKLTPSWTTYSFPFAISLKQADNNTYSHDEMNMNALEGMFKKLIEYNETTATTYLMTNRSHVNACTFTNTNDDLGVFNGATFVHEIPASTLSGLNNFNAMFGSSITTVMNINKYNGFSIVCDSIAWSKLNYIAAQGQGNANNLSFQLNGVTYYHAIKLNALAVALGYTSGFAFAIPDGTIGCLPWIPKQNREGVSTKIQTYSSMINPFDNQLYAIHNYPTAVDGSGTGGYTQDELEQYEGSIDLAFEHAPLSTSGETPIFAFAISGSIT
jgi:hypothetical protein